MELIQNSPFERSANHNICLVDIIEWDCANSIIWQFEDGIIPLRAATPRVKELEIPYESGKVHLNFPMNGIAGVVNNYSTTTAMP